MDRKSDRKLIFSLSKDHGDFEIQTFRSGGKGGQHQNTTDSGVRIIHKASGARGESRSERSQYQNKKAAFQRLAASPEFQKWLKIEVARRTGVLDQRVAEAMMPHNLKVETYTPTS